MSGASDFLVELGTEELPPLDQELRVHATRARQLAKPAVIESPRAAIEAG